jgi:hypothetical protein
MKEMFKGVLLIEVTVKAGHNFHICNPSYVGGRYWKDHDSRLTQAKKVHETSSQPVTGHGATHLSSQLREETQIEGLWCRLSRI